MSYTAANIDAGKHCFFGAEGGISRGKYASLNTNLCSRDCRTDIEHNFATIAAYFNMRREQMFTVRQSVTDIAVWADKPSWFTVAADGMATDNPDILLGIKTADCAPILFTDTKHSVIGAAHAGWRGAYKGIVENVLALMLAHGAQKKDIATAIGPCLQQNSFAVQDDLRSVYLAQNPANDKYFISQPDGIHFMFDLSGYLEDKLHALGIENVINSHIDTYADSSAYFSYRRDSNRHLIDTPRDYPTQFSCIRL